MNSNEIVKISTGTFHGLKQLKMLSLKDNLITELQLGTFKDVVMLENLLLSGNKIKFLNGKLFEFNVKLMTLAVDHNELREIGEDILDYSVALKDVDFNGNDCIYQEFKGSEVDDLKFNIKHCCKNPEQRLNVYNCGHRGWDQNLDLGILDLDLGIKTEKIQTEFHPEDSKSKDEEFRINKKKIKIE